MIKRFLNWFDDYQRALEEIKILQSKNTVLEAMLKSERTRHEEARATQVVEKIFKHGLAWFDYNELARQERVKYYQEAQMILKSDIFNNELNYLIATGAQQALLDSIKDTTGIRDFRMTINGLELLKERLEGVENPDKNISTEHVSDAI